MTPLIDGDILKYEVGWSCQFKDKETGEDILFGPDKVNEILTEKINLICEEVGATEPPIIFLSSDAHAIRNYNLLNDCELVHRDNFRFDVAVTKPYKGTRNNPKPIHYYNIQTMLLSDYRCVVSQDGYEADDEIGIYAYPRQGEVTICSRDKDLRMLPGVHYSWECGGQRAIGPHETDSLGSLERVERRKAKADGSYETEYKTLGFGSLFFYYQMIIGDSVDNIPGLPRKGDAFAWDLLKDCKSEYEAFKLVQEAYKEVKGDLAKEYFKEQAKLLWIARERYVGYKVPSRD